MSELLPSCVFTQLRRTALALACMLPLGGLPAGVLAQDVPASLRACAAESDPGMRLDCYDREMKLLLASPAQPAKPASAAESANSGPPAPAAKAATAAASTPATTQSEPAATHHTAAWKKILGGGASTQVTAHVASLDRSPDSMVLHLDNGQVWRQIGRASGDLTLRTGDEVTIEEHLGAYWLSSRYISNMRVRQESK